MGSFQELDAVAIFQSITKWSAVVENTSEIPRYLGQAFQIAVSGRPGPVYLDLPEDVLNATALRLSYPRLRLRSCHNPTRTRLSKRLISCCPRSGQR